MRQRENDEGRGQGRRWRHHPGPDAGAWGERFGGGGPGRGGRRGGGRGPGGGQPPWLAGLFGLEDDAARRGPRVRRGDVRSAILDVLTSAGEHGEVVNGYQVIQQIAERSGGAWRPSPGSVYPTIQQLQDEGLVESDEERGGRAVRLTGTGRAYVAERAEELAAVWRPFDRAPGEEGQGAGAARERGLRGEVAQVMPAVWQIATTGTDAQRTAAAEVLADARRRLYGILADGPDPAGTVREPGE